MEHSDMMLELAINEANMQATQEENKTLVGGLVKAISDLQDIIDLLHEEELRESIIAVQADLIMLVETYA